MSNPSFAGMFTWDNRDGGSLVDMIIRGGGNTGDHLKFGREIFNAEDMTIGPISNRPSSCNQGPSDRDIYISTDENSQGAVLYACTGGTWTKHWEPYAYPHPLRTGACTPSCAGKECGSDGCGGTCPPGCQSGQTCDAQGQCVSGTCIPTAEICGNGIDEDCDGIDLPCSATITVDSTYSGYTTAPIDDGNTDAGAKDTTWASAESTTSPHWVLFTFPSPISISSVDIYWGYSQVMQVYMASQEVQVQYWDGNQFITAATITNSGPVDTSSVSFSPVTTTRLRLYQPVNMGPSGYSEVMWLAEVDYGSIGGACALADTDCDGCVDLDELIAYINKWKAGQIEMVQLMQAIAEWKAGC